MAGVYFHHPTVGSLSLRLAPTSVEWTYNLNTSTTQTYAGEVVQILGVNFDQLTVSGRFGKEGPHGRTNIGTASSPRYEPRPPDQVRDYSSSGKYAIGLTQMTEYFRDYFSIASQGNDAHAVGHYNQEPMKLAYDGGLDVMEANWTVYPTSFPSYRRSHQDFAPEWQVVFEVEEADYKIRTRVMDEEISRLRSYVGYFPNNRFSDPFGTYAPFTKPTEADLKRALSTVQIEAAQDKLIDVYNQMLPAYSPQDIQQLMQVSGPWAFQKAFASLQNNNG